VLLLPGYRLAIAKVCSQPLIGDNDLELLERKIARPIDHRVVMLPAIRIGFDYGHCLQAARMQLCGTAQDFMIESVHKVPEILRC
jgi:hypothetical protein